VGLLRGEVVGVQFAAEAKLEEGAKPRLVDGVEAVVAIDALPDSHERPRAAMGEELLGEVVRRRDRYGGRPRQLPEESADLLELQTHAGAHPASLHQVVVVLVQIHRRDDVAFAVQEATRLGEEDDLVRLDRERKLARGQIGLDV
jgi:hypothetical protein